MGRSPPTVLSTAEYGAARRPSPQSAQFLTLACWGFEQLPHSAARRAVNDHGNNPHGPCLSLRDTCRFALSFSHQEYPKVFLGRSGLLSWGSSKIAPPPVQVPCVHSRTNRGLSFGLELPHSKRVPSLSFLPTSTVCSAWNPAGLLHPATGLGVRPVSDSASRGSFRGRIRSPLCLSRGRFTLRSLSLSDSCTASPRPIPSRRYRRSVRSLWRASEEVCF